MRRENLSRGFIDVLGQFEMARYTPPSKIGLIHMKADLIQPKKNYITPN